MRIGVLALMIVLAVGTVRGEQLATIASGLLPKLDGASRTVAVVDFTDLQGTPTELGRFLAEELSVALAMGARSMQVIDRVHLKAILQEHKLSASGVIDPATARQLGKLAGVQVLITGTLTPLGDSVRLSAKALDTQTAGMVAAVAGDIPRTKAIDELLARSLGGASAAKPTGGSPNSPQSSAPAPAVQRLQGAGVRLELQSCSQSGTCRLVVVSDLDTRIRVDDVRAWDDAGNEFRVDAVRIGNQEWGSELIAGVRTPVTLVFRFAAAAPPVRLSALELRFAANDSSATLRFRNIQLQ